MKFGPTEYRLDLKRGKYGCGIRITSVAARGDYTNNIFYSPRHEARGRASRSAILLKWVFHLKSATPRVRVSAADIVNAPWMSCRDC
jgi:hypothetical protein